MWPCHPQQVGDGFELLPQIILPLIWEGFLFLIIPSAKPFHNLRDLLCFMCFYVYIIQSEKDGSFYKGYSLQPLTRLLQHNNKESQYTSNKIPWKLCHLEIFDNKTAALKREKALKKYSHQQIQELSQSNKNQLQQFLTNHLVD